MSVTLDHDHAGQAFDALDRGNTIRILRAERKKDVRAGRLTAAQLIFDPPWYFQDARVFEVIEWMPGVGRHKVRRLNAVAMQGRDDFGRPKFVVNLFATLGELTPRQRAWLVAQLPTLRKRRGHEQ